MSRDQVPKTFEGSYTLGPLFVKKLKDDNITNFNAFAFYITDPDKLSFIDFNGYNKANIRDEADAKIAWFKLNQDFYWSHMCEGISFGPPGETN